MGLLGLSANLMSLGGLAIAIGMMVDGTIVMVENVDRRLRERTGSSRSQVVATACAEVARPIAFAIAIVVVVFLPLFTLQGVEGKTFRPLAYTVALAMAGSLLFAIFVAPVLSGLLMRGARSTAPRRMADPPATANVVSDGRIAGALIRAYRPALELFVRHRLGAIAVAVGLLGVGGALFSTLGSEFTPRLQEGTIVVRLTMAPSISLRESTRVTQIVERRIMRLPEVEGVVTRIGRGEVGAHADPINSAEMFVLLRPKDRWRVRTQPQLEARIRDELGVVPGVLASFTQPIAMSVDELLEGVRAELAVKLFGDDLTVLIARANEIAAVLRDTAGATDVQVDQVGGTPQLAIRVDRQAVARYGMNVADVQHTVRAAVGGAVAGAIFEGTRRFDIYVRLAPEYRDSADAIGDVLVSGPGTAQVPLSELAQIEDVVGPRQITREDNQRFIAIQANVVGRDIGSFVDEARVAIDERVDLPPGYLVTWGGQLRLQQEANRRLAVVVPITLLALFVLLYASFGSLPNAMLILLNIPLALVGGVIGLAITGQSLSVPASVGFIALFGLALENGMVLISYLNQLVRAGTTVSDACVIGACLRLRPVMMTAATTALGLLPLLAASGAGSEVQRPLATVVSGGLVTSTALTLLVLPALYPWFAERPPTDGESNV